MEQIYLFDKACDIRGPSIIFNSRISIYILSHEAVINKDHRYVTSIIFSYMKRNLKDSFAFIGEHKKEFEKLIINALLEVDKEVLNILLAKRPMSILI